MTARRGGWRELRVVQGSYLRILRFQPASSLPGWNEYVQTLTAAWRRHGIWYRADPVYSFAISGSFSAIVQACDEAWLALAAAHDFEYVRG